MTENAIKPSRPAHRRNASSKTNLLRSLVPSKSRPAAAETDPKATRTKSFPILPPDNPHAAKARVLGERQGNVQSPPSPSKSRHRTLAKEGSTTTKVPTKSRDGASSPKKTKSSTNLSGLFAKMNRSSKDLSAQVQKDKENATPPSSSSGPAERSIPAETPIWAQFASDAPPLSRTRSKDSKSSVHDEIAKYTPREYSPSKQRNFDGTLDQPSLRPTLNSRPQSMYGLGGEGFVGAIARRVSGHRSSEEGRRSEESERRQSKESDRRRSGDGNVLVKRTSIERKVSRSSTEQGSAKDKLNIVKRGGRVMAAVAALQGKGKSERAKKDAELDPKAVAKAFEAVLDSRNVPEPMRQKMRTLTLRVKADFIKQDQGSKTTGSSPTGTLNAEPATQQRSAEATDSPAVERHSTEDDSKSTKRSRSRSRTFTFSKGDKRSGDGAPSRKHRSQSKSRPTSVYIPENTVKAPSTITPTSPFASLGRKGASPTAPADYIAYLRKHQDIAKLEHGRLAKLRLLLRNETVAWVDSFVALGGLTEIVSLLHRIMALEWREDHEDQLLHEALRCLKGLCTTERAMAELEKVADELFAALLKMLFDDEKKGPAEYTTRTIIVNVLFDFLASATTTNSSPAALEYRARRILTYLGEPKKAEDERPVNFVLDMHTPRPYKLWCREVSNVTKEVFWIFLHHLNVVPLRRPSTGDTSPADSVVDASPSERAKALEATYTHRHFPGSRPPVPAAPYIGGVEWDATTYITAHLDLLNGVIASLPTTAARNDLRAELQASGFEKTMGATLRTCKEKFYSGVHDGLRAWVAAAVEDGWDTMYVREGPTMEEQASRARSASPKKNPKKKGDGAPRLEEVKIDTLPKLELSLGDEVRGRGGFDVHDDDGWLG